MYSGCRQILLDATDSGGPGIVKVMASESTLGDAEVRMVGSAGRMGRVLNGDGVSA